MQRPLALALLAALVLAAVPVATAAETVDTYEHASHLLGNRWVLWSRYGDKQAALLDTDSGTLQELPVDGWSWPLWFSAVAEGKRKRWLYGIDNTGEEWILGRTDLVGGGNPEILRRFAKEGTGQAAPYLWRGPGGTLLMAVKGSEGWMVDVFDPVAGAVQRQLGPLPVEPRFVTLWDEGRWLVIDGQRVWSYPDGETLYHDPFAAPQFWDEPPPMLPWGWPEWAVLRPDGGMFLGSWQYIAEVAGDETQLISGFKQGWRYPADGPASTAAVLYPGDPILVGDRYFLWEKGGQRLLRLYRDEQGPSWNFHTMWARPAAVGDPSTSTGAELLQQALVREPGQYCLVDYRFALDRLDEIAATSLDPEPLQEITSRYSSHYGAKVLAANVLTLTGHPPQMWQPDPPPSTVDGVLEQFAATPFVDMEGYSVAHWLLEHGPEMAVLESQREQAIPRLLEQRSGPGAYALALLGAQEADPWFRELVFDPTEHGWESGCTYPRSGVGGTALSHLHQQPLRELVKLKPAQRKAMREAAAAADLLEGMDHWCGAGGHARRMLEQLEGKDR